MSFEPVNKSVSIEDILDVNAADFDLSSDQAIRGGQLRLVGEPMILGSSDLNWQSMPYTETSTFRPVPDRTMPAQAWDLETDVDIFTSDAASNLFPFTDYLSRRNRYTYTEEQRPFVDGGTAARESMRQNLAVFVNDGQTQPLADRSGVTGRRILGRSSPDLIGESVLSLPGKGGGKKIYIQQNGSGDTFYDSVDPDRGYTLELRAMVQTETSEIIIDDGQHRIHLDLSPQGIYESSTLRLAVPWKNSMQRVRIAVLGESLFLLSQEGQAFIGTSYLTGPRHTSSIKELSVGHYTGNTTGLLLLDYFHQSHLGVFLDIEDDLSYIVDTDEHTSYSPSLAHSRKVSQFVSAVVKTEGPYNGGTTKVWPQYKNTSNPSWTDLGSALTLVDDLTEIDLTAVPVDSDGSDELRFKLIQQASETSSRPASIDQITVFTDFDPPEMTLTPAAGPSGGGNEVTLSMISTDIMDAADKVYVGGVELDSAYITHISTSEKLITMPPGNPGPVSIRVENPSLDSYFADRTYRYLASYDRVADRQAQIARVCGTRSPFRIKNEVPNGEVNLAYISAPGIEAESHVGVIDLSFLESANIVPGSEEPTALTSADTSDVGGTFTYEGAVSTEELAVSVGSAGWRELGVPAPLYYYHIVGRGRYYVKKEQSSVTIDELRDSVSVHYADGSPVALEDYPWDIVLVQQDEDGNSLPDGVYIMVILTNKKYIPGESVFLTTTVTDPGNKYRLIQGYTEIINPQIAYSIGDSGDMTYSVTRKKDGTFTLNIRSY